MQARQSIEIRDGKVENVGVKKTRRFTEANRLATSDFFGLIG